MCVGLVWLELSNSNNSVGNCRVLRFLVQQHCRAIVCLIPVLFCLSSVGLTAKLSPFKENVRENILVQTSPDLLLKKVVYRSTAELSSTLLPFSSDFTSYAEYVISYPVRVDHDGAFLSHDVKYFSTNEDPENELTKSENLEAEKKKVHLYFVINIEGKNLTLDLVENKRFVHSCFVVERFNNKKRKLKKLKKTLPYQKSSTTRGSTWPCHFRGHVIGYQGSAVAISTCNGLTGLIRLEESDYLIEPLTMSSFNTDTINKQPHKIYKRSLPTSFGGDDATSSLHVIEKQPTSNYKKKSRRKIRGKRRGHRKTEKNYDNLKNENWKVISQSPGTERQFCGVKDTKLKYHQDLHGRALWEARRAVAQRSQASSIKSSTRYRRSLSLEHWVEMMVVVDKTMADHYEAIHEGETERYVITVINMVSELFHDVSIGNAIHITLVRLVILDEDEDNAMITSHAEKTLDNFCKWAKRMNPVSDEHPNHHDVAVLLTRRNICSNSNTSCETLGLAHVAGMCQPHRSCSVNQDTGLSLAFTVAHELGHNFAMHHDGLLNDCKPDEKFPHVMAPRLTSNKFPLTWSQCSRRYITRFLDRNWGFCLMDVPSSEHEHFDFSDELPGILYDANHQCRLMFGSASKQCSSLKTVCSRLWCTYKGSCRTKLHAAVPGTKCGPGKWCHSGTCVLMGKRPSAIDGSWSNWTKWTKCSRTCGVGITISARYCNQPTPRHGGKYCLGERKRYKTCNVWSCPKTNKTISFRSEQCAAFNNVLYKNRTFSWLPVDSPVYPCELHCYTQDNNRLFADRLRDKVVDGTKCFTTGRDICVDGICKHLGCDFEINSMAEEDKCGQCRGNGLSCSSINSTYSIMAGEDYVEVGLLPKGARNIKINEASSSGNYLALRNPFDENEFYLNGDYKVQWDFHFDLAGTVFHYQRMNNNTLDNITADGPITHDIAVMLLFVEINPGVEISYIMPHNVTAVFVENLPQFQWMMQPWGACSRTCGRGFQISSAICVERKSGIVEEDFCDMAARLDDKRRICLYPKCQPEWLLTPWEPCSVTCGKEIGYQERKVLCVRNVKDDEQVVLHKARCKRSMKPETKRSCSVKNHTPCPMWKTGDWGNCSRSCGGGNQTRSVECVSYVNHDVITIDDDTLHSDDEYSDLPYAGQQKPLHENVSANEQKSSSTLSGVTDTQQRLIDNLESVDYVFEEDRKCDTQTRPTSLQHCNTGECNAAEARSPLFGLRSPIAMSHKNSPPPNQIPNIGINNSTHFDKDFDVDSDLIVEYNPTVGSREPTEYEDLLDIVNIIPEKNDTAFNVSNDQAFDTTIATTVTTSTVETFTLKPRWLTGLWGQCSTTCGVGAQIRNVICSPETGACDGLVKPAPAQRCNLKPCVKWKYGSWSKCSRVCGKGGKRRKILCRQLHKNTLLKPLHCNSIPKLPEINITCDMHKCQPWKTSRWSVCNATCGTGMRRRRVVCSKFGMCDVSRKPVARKKCMQKICVEWSVSHWRRCPVNCGFGIKRRLVKCVDKDTGKLSTTCNAKLKPDRVKKCNKGPCRVTDYDFSSCTGDRLKSRFCKVLREWGKCVQPSLAIQCCQTCRTYVSARRKNKIS